MTATIQKYCASGADVAGIGTVTWSNPTRIDTSDDSRAVAVLASGLVSHYLQGLNPSFSVPKPCKIIGVRAIAEGDYFNANQAFITTVQLYVAGAQAGTAKNPAQGLTTSDAEYTFGSASDLWGTTFTPSQVNASNFGFAISCTGGVVGASSVGIDALSMIVDYTAFVPRLVGPSSGLVNNTVSINGGSVRSY